MIRRNTASQTIYFPQLILAADGSAVTASASLTVAKDGTEATADGTLAHSANGVWKYTPTQAETDAAIVALILTATNAVPVVLNLVTTAADTAAVAMGANTTAPDNAGITAIKAKTDNLPASPAAVGSEMTLADSAITAAKVAAAALDGKGDWSTTTPPTVNEIQAGLATATELAKVIKTGEERTYSRTGRDSITFTETRT